MQTLLIVLTFGLLLCSEVSYANLESDGQSPRPNMIKIGDTKTTVAGLKNFKGVAHLKRLVVGVTKFADAGIQAVQIALPKCMISDEPTYHPGSLKTTGDIAPRSLDSLR